MDGGKRDLSCLKRRTKKNVLNRENPINHKDGQLEEGKENISLMPKHVLADYVQFQNTYNSSKIKSSRVAWRGSGWAVKMRKNGNDDDAHDESA